MAHKRVRIGIISMEFHRNFSEVGGFGKISQTIGAHFRANPHLGIDVTFLHTGASAPWRESVIEENGTRMVLLPEVRGPKWWQWLVRHSLLRREKLDLLLAIDFGPNFQTFSSALPRTPLIVWSRDPWTPDDREKVLTLRMPGAHDLLPQGTVQDRHGDLWKVLRASRAVARRALLAATDPFIARKVPSTYGLKAPRVALLPNFLDFHVGTVVKSEKPSVVFLGRLDPIKRPWLFFDLAAALPDVEFVCLGEPALRGKGAWRPDTVPPNVRMLGHLDGPAKVDVLMSSWLLVNTAIHEGLALSFLEALACETPVVATVGAGGLVERFGRCVGRWDGDGREAMPRLIEAVRDLLADHDERRKLATGGRQWLEDTHSFPRFFEAFRGLCGEAGVPLPDVGPPVPAARGALLQAERG
jgi:glycosyltransferase involved in cell wall biosynthesis